ncbi:MAG: hypothetical protein A2504_09290 [Bdellovibrionales bacterium RIFOXYD12_FULL_39_22]|nr:MAG: hypothetical protein A2385_17260 [Bdellovibrionales bacterium RIFOXYB1_FULL_39_21]OFZ41065.1 MAG: hypothetical protein A2485_00185 [Bdellovibrionales bacterium RIFOXYC12_FULL_39_17]OFZ50278.1 MAG: hypothetical protein A2404_07500 [Bdellovibrionales bacterium RIFOXYC1_FULL_39_130]OFZ71044.1 MAG: hypothetical protein A2451_16050 [Bdellovibrionales bacterium RIFOXYC2_FULL_39_8]OFZ75079.1 MAG: hypothetical protein A2560_16195 [Bdellovibrionales bacterium RIFOXYD1_FULL_39_84]OFZ92279.1 MAG:
MSISFSGITIYTTNKNLLANFLGQLLDVDTVANGCDVDLFYDGICFRFVNISSDNREKVVPTDLNFLMDTSEELEALIKKGRFLLYRKEELSREIIIEDKSGVFYLIDMDGRRWSFRTDSTHVRSC